MRMLFLLILVAAIAGAEPMATPKSRTIGVYVALADNAHQGIVPVPGPIGNGDDPDRNLYWGTAEGLRGVFDSSPSWSRIDNGAAVTDPHVLRIRTYRHATSNVVLVARAYKGSAIKACIQAFEQAVQDGSCDMAVYIGHNGLLDFDLPVPRPAASGTRRPECVVLCCKSEATFKSRVAAAGGRPILLTTQLMYPGAFILHAVIDAWLPGADLAMIREAAGVAYARNQKLSRKAGIGVFADLAKQETGNEDSARPRR
jgi:hypothetical protein